MNKIEKIGQQGKLTIGLELPLDNDWALAGDIKRKQDGRPFGVPDIAIHAKLAKMADDLGYAALWMRDVPVYDPSFGDAAQQFEAFSYLGYLSGITKNILLGTAAIVLPIREPLLTAKSAASIDLLSEGRLLMGLGLGDRAIEFPLFGKNYENRAERFRKGIDLMKHVWKENGYLHQYYTGINPGAEVYPKPTQETIPLIMAGYGQQTLEWIAMNMQGWFNYPRTVAESADLAKEWNNTVDQLQLPAKPFITAFHLNLVEDPNAALIPHRFGGSLGRNKLKELLYDYQSAGITHMALQLRRSSRSVEEAIEEIATYILPEFKS